MGNKDIDGQDLMAPRDAKLFKAARNGDHFMCPFMCNLCHSRRLRWRDPDSSEASDELTLCVFVVPIWMLFGPASLGRWQQI